MQLVSHAVKQTGKGIQANSETTFFSILTHTCFLTYLTMKPQKHLHQYI